LPVAVHVAGEIRGKETVAQRLQHLMGAVLSSIALRVYEPLQGGGMQQVA